MKQIKNRPSCLNLNRGEKLPSVWPKTTKQQPYRNYQRMDQMTTTTSKNPSISAKRNRQQSFNHGGHMKISRKEVNKSTVQTLRKEKNHKAKGTVTKQKYPKSSEISYQFRKKQRIAGNAKRDYTTTQNSSACRSGSKVGNRIMR